jgi:hypothetical protein
MSEPASTTTTTPERWIHVDEDLVLPMQNARDALDYAQGLAAELARLDGTGLGEDGGVFLSEAFFRVKKGLELAMSRLEQLSADLLVPAATEPTEAHELFRARRRREALAGGAR